LRKADALTIFFVIFFLREGRAGSLKVFASWGMGESLPES
jgi:hypothetical protein